MSERRHSSLPLFILFLASVFLISFCSMSSPLYPINIWDDANCLLTVGRAMRSGVVLYKGIYEQKGPTLYLIHVIAAAISDTSFFGVYLLEIAACFLTLMVAYKMACKNCTDLWINISSACCLGAVVYASRAFSRGDSAEEFCLPCILWMLYLISEESSGGTDKKTMYRLFGIGLLSGVVATVKFTILGVPLGICLVIGILDLREKRIRQLIQKALCFLLGMMVPIILWLIYFAANDALLDFITVYVKNNIFLYAGEGPDLIEMLRMARDNFLWILLVILACVQMIRQHKYHALGALTVQNLVLLLGGRMWPYTILILTVFALDGILLILTELGQILRGVSICLPGVVALVLAAMLTNNAFLRGKPLSSLAQGIIASCIEEGSDDFLQYSHLDDGLYLLTGTIPREKYFVRLNVDYDEMDEALDQYMRESRFRYVLITWGYLPPEFEENYRIVAYAAGYNDQNQLKKDFLLYERIR